MKQYFIILSLLFTLTASAQQTDSLWLSIPESVCPTMNVSEVVPDTITHDFFSASISTASKIQMRRLKKTDGKDIICVVKTYMAPGADSEVEFYDTLWNRVVVPPIISFPDLSPRERTILQPLLVSYSLNPDNSDLVLKINPVQLSDDEKKEIKEAKLQTTLKWNGETFK